MRQIDGRCHCGNITFTFQRPETEETIAVRACSCTFCSKHGGVYTSHPAGKLNAQLANPALLNIYTFGTGTADFYICTQCGVVPFVTSTIDGHLFAVVNVNSFENVAQTELSASVSNFDGESIEQRLARRQRTWIPQVSIEDKTVPANIP